MEEKAEGNWRVEWRAPDLGRELRVACPQCQRLIGTIRERDATDMVCEACQVQYRVWVEEGKPKLRKQTGKILIQWRRDPDMPTLGQALRGEIPPRIHFDWRHLLLNIVLIIVLFILVVLATKD